MSEETQNSNLDESTELLGPQDLNNVIQALIFASSDLVTLKKLKDVIGDFLTADQVRESMMQINEKLIQIDAPFEMVEQAKGFRFRTRQRFFPWIKKMIQPESYSRKLSQAALETLAIVAYKQPITKAEVESVRGVSCDGPLKSLLEKKLIALGSRSESVGNAFQYITTKDFLKAFGINRLPDDLPRIRELDTLIASDSLLPQLRSGEWVQEIQNNDQDPDQIEMPVGDLR